MKKLVTILLMSILLIPSLTGCRYDNKIPDNIPMSSPAAGFIPGVEITDVYCRESGVPKNHVFELHFNLRNLTAEEIVG